jgi:integrase/recombinase XerD
MAGLREWMSFEPSDIQKAACEDEVDVQIVTCLLRNGMPKEYVKELRGDGRGEAIDIYHHIDRRDLRKAYLAYKARGLI